jgi:hypothetical protein
MQSASILCCRRNATRGRWGEPGEMTSSSFRFGLASRDSGAQKRQSKNRFLTRNIRVRTTVNLPIPTELVVRETSGLFSLLGYQDHRRNAATLWSK